MRCVVLLAALWVWGCSDSAELVSCVPGESIPCSCRVGGPGAQVCDTDGKFGICDCLAGSGGAPAVGVAGTAGVAATGAGQGGVAGQSQDAGMTPVVVSGPGMVVPEPQDDAAFLWDGSALQTFALEVAPGDLQTLDSAPAAEVYVPASLIYGSERYENVGLRYKGSVGSFAGCTGSGQGLDTSGPKSCPKLSMKVSMNWMMPGGRFHGLKKLQFHSMNSDASLMRERLGYAMFREMGIAASRAVHVRLLINGEFAGLFALIEQIDSRFTRAHFTEGGDGNLYKEIWPKWTDASTYTPALRTNESDVDLSYDRVVRFATELEAAADPTATRMLVDRWMDPAYVMDFIAVDRTLVHDDGMFHWYCTGGLAGGATGNNPGQCSNHNYYWYEERGWDRLWLVPWDLDLTLGADIAGLTPINDEWNDPSPNCQGGIFGGLQRPPSCDKLTMGWVQYGSEYKAAVRRLLDGPFNEANVNQKLQAWEAQIAPAVAEAAQLGHSPSSNGWQNALGSLRNTLAQRRQAMNAVAQ